MQRRGVLSALAMLLACAALLAAADPRGAASRASSATANGVYLPLLLKAARPWQRPSSDASWLTVLNAYRANSNLSPVSENSAHSAGCRDHARYIVQTGQMTHDEDPQSPWYTPEGNQAAMASVLSGSYEPFETDRYAVESWLSTVFHALDAMSPHLASAGYGSYSRGVDTPGFSTLDWAACMDVLSGTIAAPGVSYPIMIPPDGGVQPFLEGGAEWPDPIAGCGYSGSVGGFIMIRLASYSTVDGATLTTAAGTPLEVCVYHKGNYSNPDPAQQDYGRSALARHNTVVFVPRSPLASATGYRVTLQLDGGAQSYAWSFTTAVAGQNATKATQGR